MLSHGGRILAVIAAAIPFAGVHAVQAQDFAGTVQGTVKSASGQALPGAYVKLFNAEKRLTFMIVSQAQGRYTMNRLPPGDYTLSVEIDSNAAPPASCELQAVADGRRIVRASAVFALSGRPAGGRTAPDGG